MYKRIERVETIYKMGKFEMAKFEHFGVNMFKWNRWIASRKEVGLFSNEFDRKMRCSYQKANIKC